MRQRTQPKLSGGPGRSKERAKSVWSEYKKKKTVRNFSATQQLVNKRITE